MIERPDSDVGVNVADDPHAADEDGRKKRCVRSKTEGAKDEEAEHKSDEEFVEWVKNAVHQHIHLAWGMVCAVHTPEPTVFVCKSVIAIPEEIEKQNGDEYL